MKLRIRVVDVPTTAVAEEVEQMLNAPYEDGYYLDRIVQTGIPEGVGTRGLFRLRMKSE